MIDRRLLEIAVTVWIERARRRPFSAVAIVVVLFCLTTMTSELLSANAAFTIEPGTIHGPAWWLMHALMVIGASFGMVTLCDWLLRLETPGYASSALRFAWGWKPLENEVSRALPNAQIAGFGAVAIMAWNGQAGFITLIINYVLWGAFLLWMTRSNAIKIATPQKLLRVLRREGTRAQLLMFFVSGTAGLAAILHAWLILIPLAVILGIAIRLSVRGQNMFSRLQQTIDTRWVELSCRTLPGVVFLLTDGVLGGIWNGVPFFRQHLDTQLILGIDGTLFISACGYVAGRLLVRQYALTDNAVQSPGVTELHEVFRFDPMWQAVYVRGLSTAAISIGLSVTLAMVARAFYYHAPILLQGPMIVISNLGITLAASVAVVTNTMPYSTLCDQPRQEYVRGRIEQGLLEQSF